MHTDNTLGKLKETNHSQTCICTHPQMTDVGVSWSISHQKDAFRLVNIQKVDILFFKKKKQYLIWFLFIFKVAFIFWILLCGENYFNVKNCLPWFYSSQNKWSPSAYQSGIMVLSPSCHDQTRVMCSVSHRTLSPRKCTDMFMSHKKPTRRPAQNPGTTELIQLCASQSHDTALFTLHVYFKLIHNYDCSTMRLGKK